MCDEALDSLQKTPEHKEKPEFVPSYQSPIAVKAIKDLSQVKDVRVLQNLLRNEERFMPSYDYMGNQPMITADMRKIVAEWMLDIVQQERSQPEVFCLAINILDRFLCTCAIYKTQLQLLGAVCLLIASKIREPCPILGKNLILYSDFSINAEEIKNWELLVLEKMQWELSAITPMDYLDHVIPRLGLDNLVDLEELRQRTETILVLMSIDYQFAYKLPSLLAASAIMTSLFSLSKSYSSIIRPRIQAATHTPNEQMDKCIEAINSMLPDYLKGLSFQSMPADTTTPELIPDLTCNEELSHDGSSIISNTSEECVEFCASPSSRSCSPLSAVDIFTDFNTNVLQPLYEQVDHPSQKSSASDSYSTILVN
eukprot:08684.XXX_301928_303163_1 [CDS] Oithona nana genome sequencing.